MSSGRIDMRVVALGIMGVVLVGAAVLVPSEEQRDTSRELMADMQEHRETIERVNERRSSRPQRPEPSEREEYRASDDDLVDDAAGIDPSGIDPVGFDPTPRDIEPLVSTEPGVEESVTTVDGGEEGQLD